MAEHLEKCPECRAEAEAIERLLKETEAVKAEIREAVASVNWDALPAVIADRALAAATRPSAVSPASRPWALAVRAPDETGPGRARRRTRRRRGGHVLRPEDPRGPRRPRTTAYYASGEFLDRAELEMARRNTLDYLEKSQYVLLDVFESAGEGAAVPAAFRSEQARDLLSRKKYLNAQLERFQMAKAKAICDQIEMLFRELSQIGDELPAAELGRIRGFVEERQLLLKINLVKKELQSGI